ncbi:MAG: hypothetical protein ACOH2I_01140 [Pseudomonas sp.]
MPIKTALIRRRGSACPNSVRRYLFTVAPLAADLVLLLGVGVLLWIA